MREVTIAAIQMSCSRDVKENIEKAANELEKATEGLKEVKKETDKKEKAKENKKAKTVKGWNPKTGITPVAPLLGVIAGASFLLKKKFK